MVTPLSAGFNSAIKSDFIFPKDKYNMINKLILSVHMYEPYDFTMNKDLSLNNNSLDLESIDSCQTEKKEQETSKKQIISTTSIKKLL